MKSLLESLLDDEEDLIQNTNIKINIPKFTENIRYKEYDIKTGKYYNKNSYVFDLNNEYNKYIKSHYKCKYQPNGIDEIRTTYYMKDDEPLIEIRLIFKGTNNLIYVFYINLIGNFDKSNKNRKIIAYNLLKLIIEHPDVIQYIFDIFKKINLKDSTNIFNMEINYNELLKKYNWKIKKY